VVCELARAISARLYLFCAVATQVRASAETTYNDMQ
jgi:hypothetical protein